MEREAAGDEPGGRPPMPPWVKLFLLLGVVIALLIVLILAGVFGEGHGPRRHTGGSLGETPRHPEPSTNGVA